MGIDDPLLPAAVHLTGEFAGDVLHPVVEHAGGRLLSFRCSQVHYRPAHDLVARFRTEVDWGDGRAKRETIYVGTTRRGAPPGTVPVTATVGDTDLEAGVWRWPFDPRLPALERVASSAAAALADLGIPVASPVSTDVAAYRPTERCVLRVGTDDTTWYAKAVRPSEAEAIVRRHELLRAHGLPVPPVVASDPDTGLVVMAELRGPTLRDLVKSDAAQWPPASEIADLVGRLRDIPGGDLVALRHRLRDGPHHTALLASVLPSRRDRLARLDELLETAIEEGRQRAPTFVHGDLHERQLVTAGPEVVGLLDIDECGIGDPVDDVAVPVAHLRYRALTAANGARLHRYADDLIDAMADGVSPASAAIGSAAVLAGLATAPFRAQSDGWERRVESVIDLIDDVVG